MDLLKLHNAILKVCPILGVAQQEDNAWRIDFTEDATAEEQAAAWAIVTVSTSLIEQARTNVYSEIDVQREVAIESGITWNGYPLQTDTNSRSNLDSEALAVQIGVRQDGEVWRMGNNQMVSLSNTQLLEMASAVRQHIKLCYGKAWMMKAQIAALTSVEAIEGFPVVF